MSEADINKIVKAAIEQISQQNLLTPLIAAQLLTSFHISMLMRQLAEVKEDEYTKQIVINQVLHNWQEFIKLLDGKVRLSPDVDLKYWENLFEKKSDDEHQ